MRLTGMAAMAAAILLSGCATPRIEGRDQWLAETQRTFKGRDTEQVLRAAEAVLSSVDTGRVTFLHTADSLEASREWMQYLVIATVIGRDKFTVTTRPAPGGTAVTLRVDRTAQQGRNSGAENLSTAATYRLFFNWLGYALGQEERWISCDAAEAALGLENAGSPLANAMCGPGFTARGGNPVQPRPEWARVSTQALARAVINRDQLRPQRASVIR
jgi:hypothetical protein